jgi:peptidyl-prolyl cis-trans isomerase SurA
LATGILAGPWAVAAHVVDRIIAVVNSDLITLSELKAEVEDEEKRIAQQYSGEELMRRLQQTEYEALTKMIEVRLQIQEANNKGVKITDQEVRDAVRELERQGQKVDTSNTQLMTSLKNQMTLMRVQDLAIRSTMMVTESELERYYEEHLTRFMLPEEYRISQILIKPRPGEDSLEARQRAKAVLEALQKGADFAAVAARTSDGSEALRGGSLGLVRQGELLPPIERAIATLRPGELTQPVETPLGLHLIRLEEKKPPQFRPFAEVKDEIRNLVGQQKTEDFYQAWLADLKNRAYIEVKF